jgi:hypothetical protein
MAAMSSSEDITFAISLDTPDRLDVKYISDTLRDVEQLLADIEKKIRGTEKAEVKWAWQQEPTLELVATVNGVNREDLERIVEEAEAGFKEARTVVPGGGTVEPRAMHWPGSFGTVAKNRVRNILKRLERVESITIRVENHAPVIIESAQVSEYFTAKRKTTKRMISSVEGRLELISHRGKLRAAIQDLTNPQNSVSCSFGDDMVEKIKHLFDKRVLAEGLVSYRENGTPISITQIRNIIERTSGKSLLDFIGAAPDFTGGQDEDEFMARIRDDA